MPKFFVLLIFLTMLSAMAQDPPTNRKKPRLIRDDQTQSESEEEIILPDANQAKEHVKVGDFYFKRKNFKAAADRYQEAIKYGPTWSQGYEKLSSAFEQLKDYEKAIDVCLQFLEIAADPGSIKKFSERLEKLQKKQEKATG